MADQTWFITGISSGLGRELAQQLLASGDRVAGTVRAPGAVDDLEQAYGDALRVGRADITDVAGLESAVSAAFAAMGRIDVVVANAGYGLFGAVEELSDDQIERQITTNLLGTIRTVRATLPYLREQGGGRVVVVSSVAGLTAHAGGAVYQASKWGVEGFAEALAQEVAPFGIGVTIVEPGGARTGFASSIELADPMVVYDGTPAAYVRMISSGKVPIPGDPAKVAARVIDSARAHPAPLRVVLGGDAYQAITAQLRSRLDQVEPQQESAAATDVSV